MPNRQSLTLALLSLLIITSTALASDSPWSLRVNGFYVEPSDTPTIVTGPGIAVSSDNDTGTGGGINAEYRFTPRLGLELGAVVGAHGDFVVIAGGPGVRWKVSDTLTMSTACAGLNVHLAPAAQVDVYAGPLLALVSYNNMNIAYDPTGLQPDDFPITAHLTIDDDVALGLNFGLDVPLGESDWIFNTNVRYLVTSMDASVAGGRVETVDYDPLLVGVGFGYRF